MAWLSSLEIISYFGVLLLHFLGILCWVNFTWRQEDSEYRHLWITSLSSQAAMNRHYFQMFFRIILGDSFQHCTWNWYEFYWIITRDLMNIWFPVCVSVSSLVLCPTDVGPLGFPGLQALTQVTAKLYLGSCAMPSKFLQVVNWGTPVARAHYFSLPPHSNFCLHCLM